MFLAHDIATWLGIPAGIVIAALIILRKRGMAAMRARKQARATVLPAHNQETSSQPWGSSHL
jgi:hypothetical protein